MRKIVIFPPAEIEDYLLYIDWMRALDVLGYKVFAFEDDFQSLINDLDSVRKQIEEIKPDLIIGFNTYFLGFKVEKGVLFVSLFEVLKIPYVSIVTDKIFRFCVGLKSPIRFFKFLKGIIVCDISYQGFVKELLGVETKYVPFIFPELEIDWGNIDFEPKFVLMDFSYEKKLGSLSCEFNSKELVDCKQQLTKAMLESRFGAQLFDFIPKELKATALACFVYEDCYNSYVTERLSKAAEVLRSNAIEYTREVPFHTLHLGIQQLRRYIGLIGCLDPFMEGELDRFIWFTIRSGALPVVSKKGLFGDDLPNVFSNLEELVDVFSKLSMREVRIDCAKQIYKQFLEKFPAVECVKEACGWLRGLL